MLDGVELDIDFWPKIPAYVEFEANTQQDIKNICEKLDINFNELTTIDVEKVYNYYGFNFSEFPKELVLENEIKELKF